MSRHFCDLGNGDQQSAVKGIVVSLHCSEIYRSSVKSQESEFRPTDCMLYIPMQEGVGIRQWSKIFSTIEFILLSVP